VISSSCCASPQAAPSRCPLWRRRVCYGSEGQNRPGDGEPHSEAEQVAEPPRRGPARAGGRCAARVDANGGALREFSKTTTAEHIWPVAAADGKSVVFVGYDRPDRVEPSPDGRFLLAASQRNGSRDILVISLDSTVGREATPFLESSAHEGETAMSPDGRWVAVMKGEREQMALWVHPLPGPGAGVRLWSGSAPKRASQWSRAGSVLHMSAGYGSVLRFHLDLTSGVRGAVRRARPSRRRVRSVPAGFAPPTGTASRSYFHAHDQPLQCPPFAMDAL